MIVKVRAPHPAYNFHIASHYEEDKMISEDDTVESADAIAYMILNHLPNYMTDRVVDTLTEMQHVRKRLIKHGHKDVELLMREKSLHLKRAADKYKVD